MRTEKYIDLESTYVANIYHPLDVVIERAEGIWMYDVEGKKYMDCLSAYSAVSQGHCHPRLVDALVAQAKHVTLSSRAFRNDQLGYFSQEICQLLGYDMVLPLNSGAEAVEAAVKLARKWGYEVKGVPDNQAEIIVCYGNFHGRTTTIISFSSEAKYRKHFGPFTPGFKFVPFGDMDALVDAVTPNTVAFLVEPIQGENGINVPQDGYLKFAETLCRREQMLLITDEIQVGLGRTGTLLASQHDARRHRGAGQSAVGRFLPRLRHPGRPAGDGPVPSRRPWQHVRRQPAGRSSRKCAAAACWSASRSRPKRMVRGASAKRWPSAACCARKPTAR